LGVIPSAVIMKARFDVSRIFTSVVAVVVMKPRFDVTRCIFTPPTHDTC
jgi:hypothetical protein